MINQWHCSCCLHFICFDPILFLVSFFFYFPIAHLLLFLLLLQAKLETKALKAKRPGFTDERYHETSYYIENGKSSLIFPFQV